MVNIRKAIIDDFNDLQTLNAKIFVDNPKYDDDLIPNFMDTPRGKEYLKEALTTVSGCFFVAEDNGKLIGYTNGRELDIPYRQSKYFEIENLGVIAEYRGQGIGKQLMDILTDWVRQNGYEKIYLNCYSKNSKALEFYRNNGFEDIDVCLEKKIF